MVMDDLSTVLYTLRSLEPGTPPVLHQQLHHDGDLDGAHDHVRHAQGGQDAHIHAASW